jgi:hypothetical protein
VSRRFGLAVALATMATVLAGCGSAISPNGAPPNVTKPAIVDVAIGGSESVEFSPNAGTTIRTVWTQLLYRATIGTAGTFVDLAQPGETAADAVEDDDARLRSLHPDLVTIWMSTADVLEGTPVTRYAVSLGTLVGAARATGAKVLVANVPALQRLPLYQACVDDPRLCGVGGHVLPSAAALATTIAAYNRVIAAVATAHGATVVDVEAAINRALATPAGVATLSGNVAALSTGANAIVEKTFAGALPRSLRRG